MEFLRRLSLKHNHGNSPRHQYDMQLPPNMLQLQHPDPEKVELNQSFLHRDADVYAPQMVKDVPWEKFNERVLDYGCGSGKTGFNHILPAVYRHDCHLYSVDSQESLISFASMKYPHAYVTYAVGDILSHHFPFKYIKFDKIFALNVLQSVKNYKETLTRFYEALIPGGYLGFILPINYFFDFLDRVILENEEFREALEGWVDDLHIRNTDIQHSIMLTLEKLGFTVEKQKVDHLEWTFDTVEKALVTYVTHSPLFKSLPAEMQDPLEEQLLNIMLENFGLESKNECFSAAYDSFYVIAKKQGMVFAKEPKRHSLRSRLSLP